MNRGQATIRLAAVCLVMALGGCTEGVLNPKGPVSAAEEQILLNSLGIMLAIVVPTGIAILAVAWWFRASNTKAAHLPDWEYSGRVEMIVWAIPAMTVLLLGGIGWVSAHDLDPAQPLASKTQPLTVEVVSLDWKWLFIYPSLGVASVNQLTIPSGTPINFHLTSSGVMNVFFVPQLGSQIYTMPGMVSRLALQADAPGHYPGLSANFSGNGFSDMRFDVTAEPPDQFTAWVNATKGHGPALDAASYALLVKPSQNVPPSTYGSIDTGLFLKIANPAGQEN